MNIRTALPAVTLALAACGGGAIDGGRDFEDRFVEACNESDLGAAVCDCLADKAASDLSETERAFVLAVLEEDEGTTTRLRTELGFDGAMRAGMFMTRAAECAREAAGGSGEPERGSSSTSIAR